MLEELRQKVYEADMELPCRGLITYTWGSVSGIDREKGLFVMKPNGVGYDVLKPSDMVVMDLEGNKVGGEMNPFSDTAIHMKLHNAFREIGGIVHTHSPHATTWVQAGRTPPCYGATHAGYFYGEISCTRNLTVEEIEEGYEMNIGRVIIETFQGENLIHIPAVFCKNHDPFAWGKGVAEAVYNAVVLKEIVRVSFMTELIDLQIGPTPQYVQDKHFIHKHGPDAYYGQGK